MCYMGCVHEDWNGDCRLRNVWDCPFENEDCIPEDEDPEDEHDS